jgi:hypothetical protein
MGLVREIQKPSVVALGEHRHPIAAHGGFEIILTGPLDRVHFVKEQHFILSLPKRKKLDASLTRFMLGPFDHNRCRSLLDVESVCRLKRAAAIDSLETTCRPSVLAGLEIELTRTRP